MGFNEFKELFTALNGWKQNFMMFDQDRSGTVEPHEMSQAINSMGETELVITQVINRSDYFKSWTVVTMLIDCGGLAQMRRVI